MGMMNFGGNMFTINGRSFSPDRIDTRVRLGDIEDWEFRNGSMMDHPMNIHTNPFQLAVARGNAEPA
jgi:FtsP/CotA-like multicopper oxidase with cupredoxin domain